MLKKKHTENQKEWMDAGQNRRNVQLPGSDSGNEYVTINAISNADITSLLQRYSLKTIG